MDKYIDEILEKASKNITYVSKSKYDFELDEEHDLYEKALLLLEHEGFLEYKGKSQYKITKLGLNVNKQGGWKKYLKNQEIREQRKEQKENFDFFISKFKFWTWWVPLLISVISLYISISKSSKNTNKNQKLEQTITKSEVIDIIDSISFSNQTKKVDSMHTSKIQSKISN